MYERQAQLILEAVKEAGKYPEPIPEADEELIREAQQIVSEAYLAHTQGARGELVTRILWLAEEETASDIVEELAQDNGDSGTYAATPRLEPSGSADAEPEDTQPTDDELSARASGSDLDAVASTVTDGREEAEGIASDSPVQQKESEVGPDAPSASNNGVSRVEAAYEAKAKANARIKKENLPIPPEIDGDAPVLPRDLTKCSDVDIRRLSSEFNACLARANYLVALEEADELTAKQIAEYHNARMIKILAAGEGKKTKPILEAEAADDPTYQTWRTRQMEHLVQVRVLKSLRDTYQGNCERLSREWTMRTEERNVTR